MISTFYRARYLSVLAMIICAVFCLENTFAEATADEADHQQHDNVQNTKENEGITAVPKPGDTRCFLNIEFVWIPPGEFMMGGPEWYRDEKPKHHVTIKQGFWLGKYPITQEQWQKIMGNNPSYFSGDDQRPVESVSWNACQEFIQKLNNLDNGLFRLPSKAEWEYACRSGSTTRFFWGDDPDESIINDYAWYGGNSSFTTHPVGLKKSNNWGVYDISGNVWEWCEDDWHDNYDNAPTDGSAWVDSPRGPWRVICGGAWYTLPAYCRSASSLYFPPEYVPFSFGFRVVRNP